MPAILYWIGGGVLLLFGANQAAGTVDKVGEGVRDLAIAGAVIVGGYYVLKKVA